LPLKYGKDIQYVSQVPTLQEATHTDIWSRYVSKSWSTIAPEAYLLDTEKKSFIIFLMLPIHSYYKWYACDTLYLKYHSVLPAVRVNLTLISMQWPELAIDLKKT
jgi:hypothetical protein